MHLGMAFFFLLASRLSEGMLTDTRSLCYYFKIFLNVLYSTPLLLISFSLVIHKGKLVKSV